MSYAWQKQSALSSEDGWENLGISHSSQTLIAGWLRKVHFEHDHCIASCESSSSRPRSSGLGTGVGFGSEAAEATDEVALEDAEPAWLGGWGAGPFVLVGVDVGLVEDFVDLAVAPWVADGAAVVGVVAVVVTTGDAREFGDGGEGDFSFSFVGTCSDFSATT